MVLQTIALPAELPRRSPYFTGSPDALGQHMVIRTIAPPRIARTAIPARSVRNKRSRSAARKLKLLASQNHCSLRVAERRVEVRCGGGPQAMAHSVPMTVIRNFQGGPPGPLHVAIGVFDGVHLGHQMLVRRLVGGARAAGATAVVATFDPLPGSGARAGSAAIDAR